MAQEVIYHLAKEHGAEWVRDAIQEAVIYEKRSLAYVRRVLGAWRRNGRIIEEPARAQQYGGKIYRKHIG